MPYSALTASATRPKRDVTTANGRGRVRSTSSRYDIVYTFDNKFLKFKIWQSYSDRPRDNRVTFPESGAVLDPTAIFREITAGTTFEHDEQMQAHLRGFADAFVDVAATSQGKVMLASLEGVGRAIKDQNGFVDSVRMMFRLASRVGSNPMVQFGLFLGLIGTVTGLVAHFGPAGLVGSGLQLILRRLYVMILTTALSPLYK